jgi:glycosyltransferase involved in cell wall biosynthesis
MNIVPIIIPSYEPDERLIKLLRDLILADTGPIILVNDGSSREYDRFFEMAKDIIGRSGGVILVHSINMGKGRALKDAFRYILNELPDVVGCVTADSDGQHTPECIIKCQNALRKYPGDLILGIRNFDSQNVPLKSKFGNILTRNICKFLCGISVTDTLMSAKQLRKHCFY